MTKQDAVNLVEQYLRGHRSQNGDVALVLLEPRETEFGWVFFYNSKDYVETKDWRYQLYGNAPLIVDKEDGSLYVTGTRHPIEHYVTEFRKWRAKTSSDRRDEPGVDVMAQWRWRPKRWRPEDGT
jgi:hypothetical protein